MLSFSPFDRYPYFQDKLPTIPYIKNLEETSFKISQYDIELNPERNEIYPKLIEELKNYQPENYRKSIYPFNSSLYLNYLNKTEYNLDDLNLRNIANVNTKEGLVSTPLDFKMWVKSDYEKNIFLQKFNVTSGSTNYGKTIILNTPYFHKQLYTDFKTTTNFSGYTNEKVLRSKYAGSAYLLLNSLPFKVTNFLHWLNAFDISVLPVRPLGLSFKVSSYVASFQETMEYQCREICLFLGLYSNDFEFASS
jgi:hypothetical protein